MNNYFSSIGESLAKNVPPSAKHFSEYLHDRCSINSFFFDPVTQPEIEREILSLPYNKAYGLYSCPTRLIKCAYCILSQPLADLINISVSCGIHPPQLKHAKVVPVYKSDDNTEPGNYRPISLLSVFNRIFEKVMYNRLIAFVEKNDLLYKSQYGLISRDQSIPAVMPYSKLSTESKPTWVISYFHVEYF